MLHSSSQVLAPLTKRSLPSPNAEGFTSADRSRQCKSLVHLIPGIAPPRAEQLLAFPLHQASASLSMRIHNATGRADELVRGLPSVTVRPMAGSTLPLRWWARAGAGDSRSGGLWQTRCICVAH